MERISNRKYAPKFTLVRAGADNNSSGYDESRLRNQVDELCMALFDRWCERRELTPLVYLLHAWPFFPSTPQPVKSVSASLRELSNFHREALDNGDRELIASIIALGY